MIVSINRPYDGQSIKLNPIYNDLGFVVNSDKKYLPNFNYIADIFVRGNYVSQLKHNADISANHYGIFNVGRIIESFISHDINPKVLQTSNFFNMPNSLADYYIEFGEEFSRIGNIKSVGSAIAPYAGSLLITTEWAHNLQTDDRVYIQGTSISNYNTWGWVYRISDTQFVITNILYIGNANVSDAYFISGERITSWSNYIGSDGATYVQLVLKPNSTFNVGDIINIRQDRLLSQFYGVINPQYEDIDWVITDKISGGSSTIIKTNIPFGASVANGVFGSIISRDNYQLKNLFSTKNDKSWTWNGTVVKYEDLFTFMSSDYVFTNLNKKFLTKFREIDIEKNDWFGLSYFGTNIIQLGGPIDGLRMMVDAHYGNVGSFTINSSSSNSTILPNKLSVVVLGNVTSSITPGSFIKVGSETGRVLSSQFSTNTTIITDINFASQTGLIEVTDKVILHESLVNTGMATFGCGPKNLNSVNLNGLISYGVQCVRKSPINENWISYDNISERWNFNIVTKCSRYKKWRLVWLNELGGWDYWTFNKRSDTVRDIAKSEWRRTLKSYKSSRGWTYDLGERGLTTYNTDSNDRIIVRSDFLSQNEIDIISYVYDSPEVFIIDESDNLIPISIINTEMVPYDKRNISDRGQLWNYQIEFVMSNKRTIQRGGVITNSSNFAPISVSLPWDRISAPRSGFKTNNDL